MIITRERDAQKGKTGRLTSEGKKKRYKPLSHPPLYLMFQSSGYLTPSPFAKSRDTATVFSELDINATGKDQETTDAPPTVYPCLQNFELNN